MLLGPQQQPKTQMRRPSLSFVQEGPCFECSGDHWVRNFPQQRQPQGPPKPRFPPIERFFGTQQNKQFNEDKEQRMRRRGKE